MSTFQIHTIDSAPEASRPLLHELQTVFGFIPNVAGAMAESPTLLQIFTNAFTHFHAGTFTEAQIQTLLLTNAVTNKAAWAVALHTMLALKEGIAPADVEAMRAGRSPADKQLAALSTFTRTLIDKRGHVDDKDVTVFRAAGFQQDQVLEVIGGVAASAMTNYVSSLAHPPVERLFESHAWSE